MAIASRLVELNGFPPNDGELKSNLSSCAAAGVKDRVVNTIKRDTNVVVFLPTFPPKKLIVYL